MIHLTHVAFHYGRKKPLFDHLNLDLESGAIYGLLGKNGAGKTTLLKLIAGLLAPDAGECTVMGETAQKRLPHWLSNLYFVPEDLHIPRMRLENFVKTYAVFYPSFSRALFDKILSEFDLTADLKLHELSHGQKKKAMLAFGLATNSRLLILDEPTNGLDIPSKSQFRKVLTEAVSEERTVIISTHQVRDLGSLMDPVVILDGGKILFQDSIEQITRKLNFQLVQTLETPTGVLYAERVPGGFLTITPNDNGRMTEVDIETFFNAVVGKHLNVQQLFEKT